MILRSSFVIAEGAPSAINGASNDVSRPTARSRTYPEFLLCRVRNLEFVSLLRDSFFGVRELADEEPRSVGKTIQDVQYQSH